MHTSRIARVLVPSLVGCLVLLFTASAFYARAATSNRTVPGILHPALSTSCPAPGTARAAVMPPMTLGSHANIVYIVNEETSSQPTFGTLKRFDVVTGAKVEVVKLANTGIGLAQVSADGQWLMFVATVAGQTRLQLVRMDGQDLQTLYCGPISTLQWSPTQRLVVFAQNYNSVYLLNITNGTVQVEQSIGPTDTIYIRTWLDTTHVYLTLQRPDSPPGLIALLDTSTGNMQQVFDATSSTPFCWDFDSSYDARTLFLSQC